MLDILRKLAARFGPPPPPAAGAFPDYEAMLATFYGRLDLKDTSVVDIGAHVGRHTIPLAHQVGSSGIVHAFEPIPAIRQVLVRNLAAAGINNTVVLPFALADASAMAEFVYLPDYPEESGLKHRKVYDRKDLREEKIPVKVCRLDEALPPLPVSFIKMDVEGGELDVLRGALRTLETSRPVVAFECGANAFLGYHERPDEIYAIFRSRGYVVYSITGVEMASLEQFRNNTFKQDFWDYVAFPDPAAGLHALLAR
jgi:FkbM family methyltransferase